MQPEDLQQSGVCRHALAVGEPRLWGRLPTHAHVHHPAEFRQGLGRGLSPPDGDQYTVLDRAVAQRTPAVAGPRVDPDGVAERYLFQHVVVYCVKERSRAPPPIHQSSSCHLPVFMCGSSKEFCSFLLFKWSYANVCVRCNIGIIGGKRSNKQQHFTLEAYLRFCGSSLLFLIIVRALTTCIIGGKRCETNRRQMKIVYSSVGEGGRDSFYARVYIYRLKVKWRRDLVRRYGHQVMSFWQNEDALIKQGRRSEQLCRVLDLYRFSHVYNDNIHILYLFTDAISMTTGLVAKQQELPSNHTL